MITDQLLKYLHNTNTIPITLMVASHKSVLCKENQTMYHLILITLIMFFTSRFCIYVFVFGTLDLIISCA